MSEAGQIIDQCRIFHGADGHDERIVQVVAKAVKDLMSDVGVTGIGIDYPGPIQSGNLSDRSEWIRTRVVFRCSTPKTTA